MTPDLAAVYVRSAAAALALLTLGLGGCGGAGERPSPLADPSYRPIQVGLSPRYHPPALSAAVARAAPVGRMRCRAGADTRIAAHVEIFARRRVVAIPPGIGVAPPHRRHGAFVRGGRCVYPASTRDPTGVIEVVAGARVTLGDLYDIWGQRLSARRLGGFRARRGDRVRAYVAGRPWTGDVRAIPLHDHAQVVLEIAGHVPPHRTYRFPG